jgi:hypothetical protein
MLEVGANTETLTVTDVNGNVSTCTTVVTVQDNVAPVAICQDVTVQLDATGNGSTRPAQLTTAAMTPAESPASCSAKPHSTARSRCQHRNPDGDGCERQRSTCTTVVTVEDNVNPVAICQDVTVQLDATGNGSTTANAVDNGSNDACGIASACAQPNRIRNCSEVGANTETLTVTDVNGNVSTCTTVVTVRTTWPQCHLPRRDGAARCHGQCQHHPCTGQQRQQ